MKRAVLLVLLVTACKTAPPPAGPPYQGIYQELVDAGCLAPGDASLAGVAQAYTTAVSSGQDATPGWFSCLIDGGRVGACGVPCTTP